MIILSDQLVIRGYSLHDAWHPGPMRVQAGDLLPSAGLQQALAPLVSTFIYHLRAVGYLQWIGMKPDEASITFL